MPRQRPRADLIERRAVTERGTPLSLQRPPAAPGEAIKNGFTQLVDKLEGLLTPLFQRQNEQLASRMEQALIKALTRERALHREVAKQLVAVTRKNHDMQAKFAADLGGLLNDAVLGGGRRPGVELEIIPRRDARGFVTVYEIARPGTYDHNQELEETAG